MLQLNSVKRLTSLFFLALAITALASCGSSSGVSDTPNAGAAETGTVTLLLTDAPSDIFEEINITISKAELVSDDGNVMLFEGTRTFNLLDLTDARIFSIREGTPTGSYSKIRLTLIDIELVDYEGTDDSADDEIFHPTLPAEGKLDLNPRGSFDVVANGTLAIQIDMDASKSIHIVETSQGETYQFRPVVFISIITDSFNERYIKLYGNISGVNNSVTSFQLCNTDIPVLTGNELKDVSGSGCIKVSADKTTAVFDSNGKPSTLGDLVEGEPATIFGRLKREHGDDDEDDDDEGESHEKGSKSQAKGSKKEHEDDDSDDDDDRKMDDLVLSAAVIERGVKSDFQNLKGKAASDVSVSDQFDMDVAPGQGLTTPLTINVQVQAGTILINRKGVPVDIAEINTGKLLSVRGVFDATNNTLLASLVIVDTDTTSKLKLSGKVGDNPDASCGFALLTSTGDRSVATSIDTRAFSVSAGSSKPIDIGDLVSGQQADVYGREDNGCFAARIIISY